MSIEQIKTFKDIQDAIIERGKLKDDATVRSNLKEKINTFEKKIAFANPYRWSGKTRSFVLKGKYTTGTISVTNGSHAVTGSSTAWAELSHLRWKMKIGSDKTIYEVKYVASTTSLTIEPAYQGTTGSGLSYTLFKDEYGLFPDLQNIRKLYIPQQIRRVSPEGPDKLDEYRHVRPFYGGIPQIYTVNGKNVYQSKTWATFLIDTDFWEDSIDTSTPKNKNLIIYPAIFTGDYTAQIRYTRIPPPMNSDSDEPLIPIENREVLVYGPLYETFFKRRDFTTSREWKRMYDDCLKEMQSDIENIDDVTQFSPSRSQNRRNSWWNSDEFDTCG